MTTSAKQDSRIPPPHLPPPYPVDPPEYDTTMPPEVMYQRLPEAREHFAHKLPFGVDDRTYIEFNRRALSTLDVGNTLSVETPSGEVAHIHIEKQQVHPNGDISWFGSVSSNDGTRYPAVFTQGDDSSFGSFSTPEATYSLEAEGRLGWIADINALRQYQDFSQPDVLIPSPDEAPRKPPAGP